MGRSLALRGELHLRLDEAEAMAVAHFADRSHLPANAAVRVLLQHGLESLGGAEPNGLGSPRTQLRTLALLALGALMVAEENKLLLLTMLPSYRERDAEQALKAAAEARRRLEALEGVFEDYAL